MKEYITILILGIAFTIIGVFNRKGNVSFLHKHHRKRVSEEDIIPFGKMIGLAMFIIGGAFIMSGGLSIVGLLTVKKVFETIGKVVLIGGLVAGLIIAFSAMIKYNKGIF